MPVVPYGPPGAAPPGYGYGYGYPPPVRSNGTAVASMVVSIVAAASLLCTVCVSFLALLSLAGGVTGAILGHVGRRQTRERGERGAGMALAGIIVGWIAAGLGLLAVVLSLLWIGYYLAPLGGTSY